MEGGAHEEMACMVGDSEEDAAVRIFTGTMAARYEDDGDLDID
jgi:hypothetical protein